GHVEQEDILDLAAEHAALDGCTDRDDFVGVDRAVRFLAEEGLDDLLDLRDTSRASDEDHLVDIARLEAGILERHLHRRYGALDQVVDKLLELGAGERQVEVLGTGLIRRDKRQVDVGLRRARQFHRSEEHTSELQSRENLVCLPPSSPLFPYTTLFRSVDIARLEAGILERHLHRRYGAMDQVVDKLLELGAGERQVEVLGTGLIRRDKRQVDVGLRRARHSP